MLRIKKVFCWSMLTLLAACAGNDVKDEGSVFYAVPKGSVLSLNQDLTIAGDQVAIYVQDGQVMPDKDINKYRPNCKFEIYTMSEKPRSVQPDHFEIITVVDEIESSGLQKSVQLASLALPEGDDYLAMWLLDHSLVFNYATMMYLKSDQQTDVYRMTCQHWEAVADDKHLSIAQMRQAMGDVFTLKIKE